MRRHRAMLLAPLSVLTLASCGGSSAALTMAQFISGANAICTSSAASALAAPRQSVSSVANPNENELPDIASNLTTQVAILDSTVSRLKAMGTPPSKQSAWTAGIAAIQQSADDAKVAQQAAANGNAAGYRAALGRVVQDGSGINQSFGSFGATACISGSAASPSP